MADLSTDAALFCREYNRMCQSFVDCAGCPCKEIDPCDPFYAEDATEIIASVQTWSDEHPQKTYAQDFFEKFPNAVLNENRQPPVCRNLLYGDVSRCIGIDRTCTDCWNEPMPVG